MPPSPAQVFGRRLRDLRKEQGATQVALAQRVDDLGIPMERSAVARIESAKRGVTIEEAFAFATALDVPLLSLLLPEKGGEIALVDDVSLPRPLARAWMIGRMPLSSEGVDSYRIAAKHDLPGRNSPAELDLLITVLKRVSDRERTASILRAIYEWERRDRDELEEIVATRPELAEALQSKLEESRERVKGIKRLIGDNS